MKESKKDNHCTTCDSEIPAAAPGGLCPKCLLKSSIPEQAEEPPDDDLPTMAMDAELPTDFSTAVASAATSSNAKASPPEKTGAVDFAPSHEELESLFPDLEILELLGAGGMGAVYKARQKRLDRLVALKVLSCPPELHESFSLRFEREAQLLAKLHHSNIVTIFDFGEIKEGGPNGLPLFYFLMEYVDGSDLSKRIRSGSLSVDETLAIIPQICEALQMAHDAGITHRDVKPANILLDSEGQARVADFGVAKIVENEDDLMTGLTLTGTTMGTPHYMAPEQWDAPEKVDHRSDIYSLGVIFYQMLTGDRPVGRFKSPSQKVGVDPRIDDVIYKALETKRENRYQQAGDLADDVRKIVATQAPTSRNGRGKVIALGLFAAAAIGAGVWWGMNREDENRAAKPFAQKDDGISSETEALRIAGTPESESSTPRLATERILPPALAAMKERGGRLRQWVSELDTPIDISVAKESDNLIKLEGSLDSDTPRWIARSTSGASITPFTNFERGEQLTSLGSHYGVLQDGSILHCWKPQRELKKGEFVDADFSGGSGLQFGLFLHRDGTVSIVPSGDHPASHGEKFVEVLEELAKIKDAIAIDCGRGSAAVLRANGEVLSWLSTEGIVKATPPISNAVEIATSTGFWAARLADGSIKVWLSPTRQESPLSSRSFPPDDLGPAHAIRADQAVFAAQMEDGSWKAWGGDTSGLIDKINSLGPAVDILFESSGSSWKDGKLLWIEPANPGEATTPRIAGTSGSTASLQKHTPGRLRAAGSRPNGALIDLSRVAAFDDIVAAGGRTGDWVALRSNGETISATGKADFDNIRSVSWSFGENFALIDNEGQLQYPENLASTLSDESGRANLIDVKLGKEHGIALTEGGRALVFGKRYHERIEHKFWGTDKWPMPPPEILRNIKAIATTEVLAATLTHDGTLSVFGWPGILELPENKELKKIEAIASSENQILALDSDGQLWSYLFLRAPSIENSPSGALVELNKLDYSERAELLNGESWRGESGQWFTAEDTVKPLLKNLSPNAYSVAASSGRINNVPYESLLWIEPAKSGKATTLSAPGKLTAAGTYSNGEPVDISRAEGINDFVKVVLQRNGWIGLREDGTTISSDATADRKNITNLYPVGHDDFALVSNDLSLEFFPDNKKSNAILNEELPAELRRARLIDYFGMVRHSIAQLEDGSVRVWGDRYDHPERLPEWVISTNAWPRPPADATKNVISIGGGISFAGTVTADGKLWLWDHNGVIDLGEWERLQGRFVSLRKSSHHGTDVVLEDGRILQVNKLTDKISLSAKPEKIAATYDSGYRSIYQAPNGEWFTNWPTNGIKPFLESIKARRPDTFSMNTDFIKYTGGKEETSIGLITIEPSLPAAVSDH